MIFCFGGIVAEIVEKAFFDCTLKMSFFAPGVYPELVEGVAHAYLRAVQAE